MDAREFDLGDVQRRRAAGESWGDIATAYGRTRPAAESWWQRQKRAGLVQPTRAARPAPAAAPQPVADEADAEPSSSSTVDGDPFADAARPVASAAPEEAAAGEGTALGHDAARAYLPLIFGSMDAVAGAGAIWLLRRKMGAQPAADLIVQARQLASLSETERAALEGALVNRLAAVRLSPDEALVLTVCGIYAAKALAVMALAPDAVAQSFNVERDAAPGTPRVVSVVAGES